LRTLSTSSTVNSSCTSQRPFQAIISCSTSAPPPPRALAAPGRGSTVGTITWRPVSRATLRARYSSGRKITVSDLSDSTTAAALLDVQQMSHSAFTSA
jgi:hypothetical protein